MEDLLYIFLAIVWLVISILGSRKKKQQQANQSRPEPKSIEQEEEEVPTMQAPPPVSKQEEVDFEELLDDFFGGGSKKKEKPADDAPQQAPTPVYTEERTYYSEKPEYKRKEEALSKPEDIKKFEGAITDEYEFSAEGKVETIEDLIQSYDKKYKKTEEEDLKIRVVDLEEEEKADLEFDGKKAIIYSEIINRKYF